MLKLILKYTAESTHNTSVDKNVPMLKYNVDKNVPLLKYNVETGFCKVLLRPFVHLFADKTTTHQLKLMVGKDFLLFKNSIWCDTLSNFNSFVVFSTVGAL